ncbi:hypothetical protein L21SP2_2738 [Salinispira pacifica]|uniref:ECF transporter S component n=1 Tax=Salinispira pacifica TaxID=1307761 RepID=V5WKC6_9SPIO|nr:hypothetical protein L21SP2_2738 [Salinispira pacifica]
MFSRRSALVSVLVIVSVFMNSLLNYLTQLADLPIFMDSMFTVLGTALLGPWWGMVIGVSTNLLMDALQGFSGILWPFAAAQIVTVLVTHIMIRRNALKTVLGVTLFICILAVLNALAGTVIAVFAFGGFTLKRFDFIVHALIQSGQSIFSSAFVTRVVINIVDKGIAVLVLMALFPKLRQYLKPGGEEQ